ncbi:hypothetical protein CKO20_08905 [Rhodocyclus tenuis]|nr:hypothetical protein [Rhodocyclus tenuis]
MSDQPLPDMARLSLSGELTIYTAAEIRATLAEAMEGVSELEVDLSEISDMDTAGLQLLLLAKRNPRTEVRLSGHSPAVLRLLGIANLGSALDAPLAAVAAES